jgi:hypothetical protein
MSGLPSRLKHPARAFVKITRTTSLVHLAAEFRDYLSGFRQTRPKARLYGRTHLRILSMIVLHHLASSGGTVFSKALAAQDNCLLLNEVHPYFSNIPDAAFSPTTPLDQYLARYRAILPQDQVAEARQESFRYQLHYVAKLATSDKKLLVREWSHGDFFASERFSSSILPLVDFTKALSLVLLRHPVDCFLSGKTYNAWNLIKSDIAEFCHRYWKFTVFFKGRAGVVIVKYEDFVAQPDSFLKELCAKLGIEFNPGYMARLNQFRLSGASGRTSYEKIAPRPRRPISEAERDGFLKSQRYFEACALLGYQPEPL